MDMELFAKRLKKARSEQKVTQKELAELSGLSSVMISSYEQTDSETGKNPSLSSVYALAAALNISIDWLCGLTEKQNLKEEKEPVDLLKLLIQSSIYLQPENALAETAKPRKVVLRHCDAYDRLIWNIPLHNNKVAKDFIIGINRIRDIIETGIATPEMIDLLVENLYLKYKNVNLNKILCFDTTKTIDSKTYSIGNELEQIKERDPHADHPEA